MQFLLPWQSIKSNVSDKQVFKKYLLWAGGIKVIEIFPSIAATIATANPILIFCKLKKG